MFDFLTDIFTSDTEEISSETGDLAYEIAELFDMLVDVSATL